MTIGRLALFFSLHNWEWKPLTLNCPHCHNLYVGPFGIEWSKRMVIRDDAVAS